MRSLIAESNPKIVALNLGGVCRAEDDLR